MPDESTLVWRKQSALRSVLLETQQLCVVIHNCGEEFGSRLCFVGEMG
jgi:hypothetical protein